MSNNTIKTSANLLVNKIFSTNISQNFENIALEIFRFQYSQNSVYREYVNYLGFSADDISNIEDIPFLPVEFFKTHKIILDNLEPEIAFLSSSTTGSTPSRHYVFDTNIYKKSYVKAFQYFFGKPEDFCFLALLPSYIEREGSSLIYMINELMKLSNHQANGYYLNEYDEIIEKIKVLKSQKQKFILFGVTYALLDFAELLNLEIELGIVMETGGMKGKRKELSKPEIHELLKKGLKTNQIHSEYGMTELLSQAYSFGNNLFQCPPWMKVLIRDTYDPFNYIENGTTGGINIIDLANIFSCSFIETKDLGKMHQNGQFEVLGRFDNSDIRGCNLLVD